MNKKNKWFLIIGIFVVVIAGYFLFWSPSTETGILRLQITDAPSTLNISKALVTISDIEVHLAPGTTENISENDSTGWFSVVAGPVQYDLIAIKDVNKFLGSKILIAGKYTQVRLDVDEAIVTINGTEHNLTIPSGDIKLMQGFDIPAGETTTLTLDFDAAESIKATGKDTYVMNPTIKIIQE